jgi:hypothetical protein
MIQGILNDPFQSYGLLGRNCVDFVREVLEAAGLEGVSERMQWVDAPVNHYAVIMDWLDGHGFGPIMEVIGDVLGEIGELGNMAMDAVGRVWDFAMDIGQTAFDFVMDLGDQIGGFASDVMGSIFDFFGSIFGPGPGHEGDTPVVNGFMAVDDDWLVSSDMALGTGPDASTIADGTDQIELQCVVLDFARSDFANDPVQLGPVELHSDWALA